MTTAKIVEMIKGLFYGPFYDAGNYIWNFVMTLVYGAMTTTPQGYSKDAWDYVVNVLYPWSLGIGATLLNLFFLIGFFKQTANIKENLTTEIFISLVVRLIMANVLMLSGLDLIQGFFMLSSGLSAQVFYQPPSYAWSGVSANDMIFFWSIYGVLYMCVAIVSAVMIFLAVYGRYLKLYLAVATGAPALSTLAGGIGIENTAYAWIKGFLGYVFEIVIIAIELSVAGKIIGGIDWGQLDGMLGFLTNESAKAAQAMFTMVIMAGSVKGTDVFMHKMYAL